MRPTITVLERAGAVSDLRGLLAGEGRIRFRLEGGVLREDWAESLRRRAEGELAAGREPDERAYCEITVAADPTEGVPLLAYGGSVWPTAWPELFAVDGEHPSHNVSPTAEGASALRAALRVASERKTSVAFELLQKVLPHHLWLAVNGDVYVPFQKESGSSSAWSSRCMSKEERRELAQSVADAWLRWAEQGKP